MRFRIVSWLVRGLPCQFLVIWENKRCSIWGEIRSGSPGLGQEGIAVGRR
jgi:hypothetical protein